MLFLKKKGEAKSPACTCSAKESTGIKATFCPEAEQEIRCIKVLGMGCKSCHQQYENAKEAAKNIASTIEVEYITDLEKVMSYGAISMPAIVVNEQVVSMGKVLSSSELEKLLNKLGF